jgi:hypothetical protein
MHAGLAEFLVLMARHVFARQSAPGVPKISRMLSALYLTALKQGCLPYVTKSKKQVVHGYGFTD